jgi:hypothetical protein
MLLEKGEEDLGPGPRIFVEHRDNIEIAVRFRHENPRSPLRIRIVAPQIDLSRGNHDAKMSRE